MSDPDMHAKLGAARLCIARSPRGEPQHKSRKNFLAGISTLDRVVMSTSGLCNRMDYVYLCNYKFGGLLYMDINVAYVSVSPMWYQVHGFISGTI